MSEYYKILEETSSDLDVLYYEIEMLNRIPITETQWPIENKIRIESFLLHARNLLEFLLDEGHLKCSQFLDASEETIDTILSISDFKDLIEVLNEHLSHISKKRVAQRIKWDLPLIKAEVNRGASVFLDQVSPRYFPTIKNRTKSDFETLLG